jgi:hypothetical protein
MRRFLLTLLTLLLAPLALTGCAPSEETARQPGPQRAAGAGVTGFTPAASDHRVHTVQLYRTGRESAMPVFTLGSGQTLTLEFDMLDDGRGGPVSVYFYHKDRFWNRQLMSVEYLRGFQSDDIRDFEQSAGTRLRYTHYTYRFPNRTIDFTRSGNFILRVTEPGDERAILFERAFFISEETAEVDLAIQSGLGAGIGGPFLQPVARVRPPAQFASPIFEYDVCFARNGRFDVTRCADEPTLLGASLYQFFLPRQRSFGPPGPRYPLDLSVLGAGPQVAAVDLSTTPFRITLSPDDARFSTAFFDDDLLTGQSIVRAAVRDASRPATDAEYVETTFQYVPQDQEPAAGAVILSGSFNGWAIDPRFALTWDDGDRVYRGQFLIKQGLHAYTYFVDDPVEQERRERSADLGIPSVYTAMVYLHDPAYNTDRLVSVQNVLGQ